MAQLLPESKDDLENKQREVTAVPDADLDHVSGSESWQQMQPQAVDA